ncbi:hypothetical protein OXYTRIMIC_724 [Oxytricha trifallax]|uniref:Uncharacterized protein n=1 Tax=Oxytricha trifallax TaxID=1172189 RepID=A0A073I0T7_9SPIT|nr:hypothetical protein OXYTRIMIC_724 [Oxytricha trifallax]
MDEDQSMRERHQHDSQSNLDEQEEPSPITKTPTDDEENQGRNMFEPTNPTQSQPKEEKIPPEFEEAQDRVLQSNQLKKSVKDDTKFLGFSTIQHMNKWIQNQSIEIQQTISPPDLPHTITKINIKLSINFQLNLIKSQICFKNTIVDILRFKKEKQLFEFLEFSGAYEATLFFLEEILKEVENERTNHYNCFLNGKQRNDQEYCAQMMKNYKQATSDSNFISGCIQKLQLFLMSL